MRSVTQSPKTRHHSRHFPARDERNLGETLDKRAISNEAIRQGSCVSREKAHEVFVALRSTAPASPAFEAIVHGARFRDRIAIVVKASPESVFQALHEVTLRDMKLAWFLGEFRYRPSRLAGHMPAADSKRPFLAMLTEGGTLVLRDETPREVITGSAAQLHRVHQAPQRFADREAFEAFDDPGTKNCL